MRKQNVQKRHNLISEKFEKGTEKLLEKGKDVPNYYYQLTAEQKDTNDDKFKQMTSTVNFLKNARYKESKKVPLYKEAQPKVEFDLNKPHYFVPNKKLLEFKNFELDTEYKQSVKFINRDKCLRRMKFIPPSCAEFAITEVIYPSKSKTEVAAGNSIEFIISFKSAELKDIDDKITIISDKDNYDFPILARPEKPIINLEKEFECKSCWFGQTTKSYLNIKNSGGYSRFQARIEEKNKTAFKIDDECFELKGLESKTIVILFDPRSHGAHSAKLVLTDMYDISYDCLLYAEANVVEIIPCSLETYKISKAKVKYFTELNFNESVNNKLYSKKFEFVNSTENSAEFEWEIQSDNPNVTCTVSPNKGTFKGKSKMEFTVDIITNSMPGLYKLKVFQYLLNIPQTALVNSSNDEESCEKVLNHSFDVNVEVVQKPIKLSYDSYKPKTEFYVKENYTFEVELYYDSNTEDKLFVNPFFISSDLDIRLKALEDTLGNNLIMNEDKEQWYEILGPNKYTLIFEFKSDKAKAAHATFNIQIANSYPLQLDFEVLFIAPQVIFSQTFINLGFLPLYSECSIPLEIKNLSRYSENIILLNRQTLNHTRFELQELATQSFDIAHFILFNDDNQITMPHPYLNISGNKQRNALINITSNEEGCLSKDILLETESYLQTQDLSRETAGIFYPKPLQQLRIVAQYEKPELVLNRYSVNFDRLCVEKKYIIKNSNDPKILYLRNTNNFALKWRIKCLDPEYFDIMECNFYPKEGILEPLQSIKVKTKLSIYKIASFTARFKVSYEPIGLLLSSEEKNSTRTLVLTEGSNRSCVMTHGINSSSIKSNYTVFEYNFIDVQGINVDFKLEENHKSVNLDDIKVESVIMDTVIRKFTITNLSDLNISFKFAMKHLPIEEIQYESTDQNKAENVELNRKGSVLIKNKSTNSIRSKGTEGQTRTSIFSKKFMPTNPLNLKQGKQYNFKNKNARELQDVTYYNQIFQKTLDRLSLDCIVGISIKEGNLKAYEKLDITVMFYADSPADYEDELIFNTNNGFEKRIKAQLSFLGMPIALSENQVGLKKTDRNNFRLSFGDVIYCGSQKQKTLKIINRSSKTIKIYTSIHNVYYEEPIHVEANSDTKESGLKEMKIDYENTIKEKEEFIIDKRELMIPQNSTMPLQLAYNPLYSNERRGITEKALIIQTSEQTGKNDEKITVQLFANKICPLIEFIGENNLQSNIITFYKYPSQKTGHNNPSFSHTNDIAIKNMNNAKIGFLGILSGPFKFFNSNSNRKVFELNPYEEMTIKILFEGFHHKDYKNWPKSPSIFIQGQLMVDYGDYYKDMNPHSVNLAFPEPQVLNLEGILLRPQLALAVTKHQYYTSFSEELEIDFGVVHHSNKKTLTLYLLNTSKIDAKYKINNNNETGRKATGFFTQTLKEKENEDYSNDNEVFSFDSTEGVISADATYFTNAPENIDFNVNSSACQPIKVVFKPKNTKGLYKSYYEIACKHGMGVRFSLKGIGTDDENFMNKHTL